MLDTFMAILLIVLKYLILNWQEVSTGLWAEDLPNISILLHKKLKIWHLTSLPYYGALVWVQSLRHTISTEPRAHSPFILRWSRKSAQ